MQFIQIFTHVIDNFPVQPFTLIHNKLEPEPRNYHKINFFKKKISQIPDTLFNSALFDNSTKKFLKQTNCFQWNRENLHITVFNYYTIIGNTIKSFMIFFGGIFLYLKSLICFERSRKNSLWFEPEMVIFSVIFYVNILNIRFN